MKPDSAFEENGALERKTVSGIKLTLLLMGTLMLTFDVQPVKSGLLTRLYISPESVEAYVGDAFTVDVKVADVLNLSSLKIKLGFDFFFLEVVKIVSYAQLSWTSVQETHANPSMQVEAAVTIEAEYSTPISGGFELLSITFRAINTGNSTLSLQDSSLIDSSGLRIPHETSDGFVTIVAEESWMARQVGVEVDDWALYAYNFTYCTNDPNPPMPPPPSEFFEIDWVKTIVREVQNTRVTLLVITHYKNCTEQTIEGILDVHTGKAVYTGPIFVIGANLSAGASLYAFAPPWNEYKINETIFRRYMGVLRETNHFSRSSLGHFDSYEVNMSMHIFWDRATGILTELEARSSWVNEEEDYRTVISGSIKIVDSNVWQVLAGDVNFDGKVDLDDIVKAALAFGSYPSHPRWNLIADINRDGKVDIDDLILIALNFGKTHP
jgi:hypothetical protein